MLAASNNVGGGGYAIISDCDITSPGSLQLILGTGLAMMDSLVEFIASGSSVGPRKVVPAPITLPNNATSYIWMLSTGGLGQDVVMTPPANARIYLGRVVTLAGVVTAIDYSGRPTLVAGRIIRQCADTSVPTDAPPADWTGVTLTAIGNFWWDGSSHKFLTDLGKQAPTPWRKITLSGDLVLTNTDANIQFIDAGSANRNVTIVDPTTVMPTYSIAIYNSGAAHNLVIKDHSGTTLCTLTPGQSVGGGVYVSGGTNVFPTSWTGGTPTGAVPVGGGSI